MNQLEKLMNSPVTSLEQIKHTAIDLAIRFGPKLLVAILILFVGFVASRWVSRWLARGLSRIELEPPVRTLLARIGWLLTFALFFVMALQNLGVELLPLVAGVGVAGAGLALATQGVLGNLVAGLSIIFAKPFRVGEFIEINNVQGQVQNIELFSTTLLHGDLSRVVIPNRKIVGEILHNYGNIRQLDLSVGVGYGSNVQEVLALVQDILAKNPRVLQSPAPGIGVSTLGDCSINIAVKPWTNLENYGAAQAEIYQTILDRFRAKNIEIPFPQREVRLLNHVQQG